MRRRPAVRVGRGGGTAEMGTSGRRRVAAPARPARRRPPRHGASRRVAGVWCAVSAAAWLASTVSAADGGPPRASPSAASWGAPVAIAATDARLVEPLLLADSSGVVHLFFAGGAPPQGGRTTELRYARWVDGGWSDPVTVLASARGGPLAAPALALDARGWLHVVYAGPNWGRFGYRRVHLSAIMDAKAWSQPTTLSESSGMHAAIAVGPGETLYVLYSSHNHDVLFQRSEDGGHSWSDPLRLSKLDLTQQAPDDPRLAVDARGRVHAAWTQFPLPAAWPPADVYYRRSEDGGRTWSPVRQVAGDGSGRINVAAQGDDEVHLVWTEATTRDRMHEWSTDGGATWSTPRPVGDQARGAITRALALAFDGGGVLHLVTSVGSAGGAEPVVHATWRSDGGGWSVPQGIANRMGTVGSVGLPALAIGGGNRLHVAYKGDDERIWYVEGHADAPPIAPRAVPMPATDLRSYWADASTPLRVVLTLLALLGVEASVSGLCRAWRRRSVA